MSYEVAAQIILIGSLFGMGAILFRKIPILVKLPKVSPRKKKGKEPRFFQRGLEKIKKIGPLRSFSFEIFLQKILSKIRILSLKTDNKTFNWLQKLREKAKKNKSKENDNYWEKLKKSTKK